MEDTEKMLKIIIATHPNPTPIVQDIYDSAKIWEKPKIKETALKLGIKVVEKNQ